MAQPITTVDTKQQDQIQEKLCGCTDDIVVCCCGCWCVPCLFGANAQRIDGKNCIVMCLAYLLLIECYLCWVPHFIERQKLRKKYNIKQDDCEDILLTMCCAPCALCQETREMNRRENITTDANKVANGGPIVTQPQPQPQFQPYGSYYPEGQYQQPVQYQPQDYYQPPVQYQPQDYYQPPVQYQPQDYSLPPVQYQYAEQYPPQDPFQSQAQYQPQDQYQPQMEYQPQEQSEPEKPSKPKRPFKLHFSADPEGGSTAQVQFLPRDPYQSQAGVQPYDPYAQYPPQEQFNNNMTL